jgi:hypothetical protein
MGVPLREQNASVRHYNSVAKNQPFSLAPSPPAVTLHTLELRLPETDRWIAKRRRDSDMRTRNDWRAAVIAAWASMALFAQSDVQVQRVEMLQPGGTIFGKLMTVGDRLIFVDDNQVNSSISIPRTQIRDVNLQEGLLTVELQAPVRDRSGQTSRLSFRVGNPVPYQNWYRNSGSGASAPSSAPSRTETPPAQPAPPPPNNQPEAARPNGTSGESHSYQARHNHFLTGGCNGKLLVLPDRLIYESVDDSSHSRQWQYSDIREIQLDNPYKLEVKPFTGGDYDIQMVGQALESSVYQTVVDRIVRGRVR